MLPPGKLFRYMAREDKVYTDWDRAITDLSVWLGRKVLKPGGGMGEITGVTECDGHAGGIGPDRKEEGIQIDGTWYPLAQVVGMNPALVLPDDEDWIF